MSSRRQTPGPGPSTLADVLEGTRRVTLQRTRAAVDKGTWRQAVGTRIADRTEVGQLRDGELTVHVASAAWAQELSLLTREILERLASHGVKAERVRFRVRPELGAAKPKPGSPAPGHSESARPPAKLPDELRARLIHVEDDELRGAIAGAAGLAFARLAKPPEKAKPPATSVKPDARSPRAAAARSAPPDQSSAAPHANPRRKRGGPAG
jgi:hypothetical protein